MNHNKNVKNLPLVSVVVISYNHQRYVGQCIDSVLSQTYENKEIIVIDNGSDDGCVEKIEFMQSTANFKFIKNKKTRLVESLQHLSSITDGKYISFVAGDDFWSPGMLAHNVEVMEGDANIGACSGRVRIVNHDGMLIDTPGPSREMTYHFDDFITEQAYFPAPVSMMRREALISVGWHSPKYALEDIYMWFAMADHGWKLKYTPDIIGSYRRHDSNVSKVDPQKHKKLKKELLDLYPHHKNYELACLLLEISFLSNLSETNRSGAFVKMCRFLVGLPGVFLSKRIKINSNLIKRLVVTLLWVSLPRFIFYRLTRLRELQFG